MEKNESLKSIDVMEKTEPLKPIDVLLEDFHIIPKEQRMAAWTALISQQPPPSWLKNTDPYNPDNKYLKDERGNLIPYMPIERVEFMFDKLLMNIRIEVLDIDHQSRVTKETITQSSDHIGNPIQSRDVIYREIVVMKIRLHYFNWGIGGDSWTDGVATGEITGKQPVAVVHAKLKAEAVKNAAKSLGNIFGRRIGREDLIVTEDNTAFTGKASKHGSKAAAIAAAVAGSNKSNQGFKKE